MSHQNEKKQHKVWDKIAPFLKNSLLNRKVFYPAMGLILAALAVTVFLVIRYENRHEEVKKLYAEAFYKYRDIQSEMDKLNQERAGLALAALEKVSETGYDFPENYLAEYDLAVIYLSLNKPDLAQKKFEAVMKAPKNLFVRGKAMAELAKLYQNQEKYDEALSVYQRMIDDYTNFYRDMAYYSRGMVYEIQGKIDLAISSYKLVGKESSYGFDAERSIEVIEKVKRLN